jgi:hypothetical protein
MLKVFGSNQAVKPKALVVASPLTAVNVMHSKQNHLGLRKANRRIEKGE